MNSCCKCNRIFGAVIWYQGKPVIVKEHLNYLSSDITSNIHICHLCAQHTIGDNQPIQEKRLCPKQPFQKQPANNASSPTNPNVSGNASARSNVRTTGTLITDPSRTVSAQLAEWFTRTVQYSEIVQQQWTNHQQLERQLHKAIKVFAVNTAKILSAQGTARLLLELSLPDGYKSHLAIIRTLCKTLSISLPSNMTAKPLRNRQCETCHSYYTPTHPYQEFCSTACYKANLSKNNYSYNQLP